MEARYSIDRPDNVTVEVTIKATVGEFRAVSKALGHDNWPCIRFARVLRAVIDKADKYFVEQGSEQP